MKIIFIKDDRLREITAYRSEEIVRLSLNGTITGSYTIKESSKEYEDGIYFGWDIIDSEDGWKLKDKKGGLK